MQWNKTYSTIALAKSAMECIPLHSWEMEFSIQYHVTINSQLNDQNSIRYYINRAYLSLSIPFAGSLKRHPMCGVIVDMLYCNSISVLFAREFVAVYF